MEYPDEFWMAIKVFISLLVGYLIGYLRREKSPAGSRTFMLITLGATLFTIISVDILVENTDPTRIVAGIVTGVGFLGVGVIWKHKKHLSGLTTAATIWVAAAIGITIGLGEWFLTLISTIPAVLVLYSREKNKWKHKKHKD